MNSSLLIESNTAPVGSDFTPVTESLCPVNSYFACYGYRPSLAYQQLSIFQI